MAINNLNNNIGFPRLTNNPSSMFMTLPTNAETPKTETKLVDTPVESLKNQKKDDTVKYLLGAVAVAASAIAGIYIYKGRMPTANVTDVQERVYRSVQHIKDNFLESMNGKCPDLGIENKKVHTFEKLVRVDKNSKSILKANSKKIYEPRGLKRVEEVLAPAGVKQTSFVNDKGKERAVIIWDEEGNVYNYLVKNDNGDVIRSYESETGITTKFIYNKENVKLLEVMYNGKGWSYEQRFDEKGKFVSENTFCPELEDIDY